MNGDTTPMRAPAPAGQPTRYSKEQIVGLLRGTDPQAVSSSGRGYLGLADSYGRMRTSLRGVADDLAHVWKGPAAAAAQAQLRDLFVAAHEMHTRAHQVGAAVRTHGDSYLSWYKNNMPTPDTDADAQAWMDYANRRVAETWNALPPELTTTLPPVSNAARNTAGPYGGSSAVRIGSDRGSTGGRHGQGSGDDRFGPGDQPSLHDRHSGPYDAGGVDLAGFEGSRGTGFGGGLGGPSGSAPDGMGSSGSPVLGGAGTTSGLPTAGGASSGMPGTTGIGAGAAPFGTDDPAVAREAAGMRPTGSSGAGEPMLSAGGGQGRGERELTRNKWSPEDRETWTGKSSSTPGVIGGPDGEDADRTSRSSKRDEDEDRDPTEGNDGDENELTDEPANGVPEGPDAEDPFSELEAEVSLEDLDLPGEWQV